MDGFTGNVALKASETLAESLMDLLKEELSARPLRKLGACSRAGVPGREAAHRSLGVRRGAAPGGEGLLRDRPRRSNALAVKHGIRVAAEFFSSGVNEQIEAELRSLGAREDTASGRPHEPRFVFPGQGSQKVGMGRALAEASRRRGTSSPKPMTRSASPSPACASRGRRKSCSSPPTRSPRSSP